MPSPWPPGRGEADFSSRKARSAEEKARERNERKLAQETVVLEFDYHAGALAFHGPIINTQLTISEAQRQALASAGLPIPPPVTCRFLVDTGADGTVVKHEFAERAGLKLISDNTPLAGVGVDTTGKTYMGRIVFACESKVVPGARQIMVVDTRVMGANLGSDLLDGLIGRDVLQYFAFSYDGKTGKVRMRFHKPERAPGSLPT